jgi:predicted metallopeptidase
MARYCAEAYKMHIEACYKQRMQSAESTYDVMVHVMLDLPACTYAGLRCSGPHLDQRAVPG